MNVTEQIAVLQNAINQLSEIDGNTPVSGHFIHPEGGYGGDFDGEVYKINVEPPAPAEDLAEMDEEERKMYGGVILNIYNK